MAQRIYDADTALQDAGAITSSAAGAVASVAQVIDLGSATAAFAADWVLDVSAIDTASGNETYVVALQGDTDSGFGSAVTLASKTVTAAGNFVAPITNDIAGTKYRYIREYATLGGTTPSLNRVSFLSKGLRP